MNAKTVQPAGEAWYASPERTSQTDDQRIKEITVLPPPEHLLRPRDIRLARLRLTWPDHTPGAEHGRVHADVEE